MPKTDDAAAGLHWCPGCAAYRFTVIETIVDAMQTTAIRLCAQCSRTLLKTTETR